MIKNYILLLLYGRKFQFFSINQFECWHLFFYYLLQFIVLASKQRQLKQMLPAIKNNENQQYLRASQPKVYNPVFQSVKDQSDKKSLASFSHSTNKILSRAAVRKQQPSESPQKPLQNFKQGPIFVNSNLKKYRNMPDMTNQIREIEKKIRQCQKKLEYQRKKQQLMMETGQSQQYDFQKVIQRELQLQHQNAESIQANAGFDYLTNPGKNGQEQQQQVVQQLLQPPKQTPKSFNLSQNIEKLQKHYQNNLKKKFERRQMFPHQPCRRKTPKLFITQKNNALKKNGRAGSDQQHLFRVFTKQTTPQQIYPTIPNFAVVKDNLSKNIVAYLGDYKPFLQKTKQSKTKGGLIDTIDEKKSQQLSRRVDAQQQICDLKIDQKISQEPAAQIINISNSQ